MGPDTILIASPPVCRVYGLHPYVWSRWLDSNQRALASKASEVNQTPQHLDMVACTRFELVFPCLKGKFPVPLEEHATEFGSPTEGRTPVCTLRGCRPVLLDDRAIGSRYFYAPLGTQQGLHLLTGLVFGGGQEIRTLISLLARQVASH